MRPNNWLALETATDCYLAGIVTGTKKKESVWREKYGIKKANIYNYENFDSIASNDDIDIVYIVLPNSMHAEYTIRAAKAGKHVICEKPMALNAAEGQTMIDACKANGVMLSIGYRLHFDLNTIEIMKLAKEQPYGPVKYVQSEAAFAMGNNLDAWRLNRDLAGGGAIMDMGIYCIQAARYATGEEPIAIRAQEIKTDWKNSKKWTRRLPGKWSFQAVLTRIRRRPIISGRIDCMSVMPKGPHFWSLRPSTQELRDRYSRGRILLERSRFRQSISRNGKWMALPAAFEMEFLRLSPERKDCGI